MRWLRQLNESMTRGSLPFTRRVPVLRGRRVLCSRITTPTRGHDGESGGNNNTAAWGSMGTRCATHCGARHTRGWAHNHHKLSLHYSSSSTPGSTTYVINSSHTDLMCSTTPVLLPCRALPCLPDHHTTRRPDHTSAFLSPSPPHIYDTIILHSITNTPTHAGSAPAAPRAIT